MNVLVNIIKYDIKGYIIMAMEITENLLDIHIEIFLDKNNTMSGIAIKYSSKKPQQALKAKKKKKKKKKKAKKHTKQSVEWKKQDWWKIVTVESTWEFVFCRNEKTYTKKKKLKKAISCSCPLGWGWESRKVWLLWLNMCSDF